MRWSIAILGAALLTALAPTVPPVQADQAQPEAQKLSDVVQRVHVPGATAMAVHDERGLLVVGHTQDGAARLSVFALDELAQANAADEKENEGDEGGASATVIDLPRPDALAKFAHAPLAMTFHPELPVLYVWQDIRAGEKIEPDSDAHTQVLEHLDHLVIYRIEGEGDQQKLTRAGAFCRGQRFAYGQAYASLAVAGDGERLFVPNLMGPFTQGDDEPVEPENQGAVGYFDLDAEGMLVPVPVPIEGTLDGYGVNEYDMQIRPDWVYTAPPHYVRPRWLRLNRLPTGTGYFAPTKRTLVFGSAAGFGLWDTVDRRGALSEITLIDMPKSAVAGHPTLPMLYAAARGRHVLACMRHAQGFPTLLPEQISVSHANFQAVPVVFQGARHGLAIGGQDQLHLIGLDDTGAFTGQFEHMPAPSDGPLQAVAYSQQRDRVYVAVDQMP